MFQPQVLEKIISNVSGTFEVRRQGRGIYVTTSGLTQSGGLIHELWSKTLKRIKNYDLRFKSWLILGLATGTLAKIISDKYSPVSITGVELDPEMIRVGKKYFGLDKIPNLEIKQLDAKRYTLNAQERFDVVIVDLYVGDQLPQFVYSKKFLEQLDKLGQLVILNHLFYDEDKRTKTEKLVDKVNTIFPHVQLIRELTNLMIICA